MSLKKVEAISLYQTPRRALEVETELHKQLRAKFGNVSPHNVTSSELYKVEHLEAILGLLHEIEQKPSEPSCQNDQPTDIWRHMTIYASVFLASNYGVENEANRFSL